MGENRVDVPQHKTRKEEKTMTIRRGFIGLAIVSILVIGSCLLGSVPQATAETLNFKMLAHVTKAEMVPIADVEGHNISIQVREGVAVYGNGEWAWLKANNLYDTIKGAGTANGYTSFTFLDGSTFIIHTKGTLEGTPQGVTSAATWTADVVQGTGRFQGIKGTLTYSIKVLPPEKGEPAGKSLSEGTLVYTLPGK
jgi:hypothetical protein